MRKVIGWFSHTLSTQKTGDKAIFDISDTVDDLVPNRYIPQGYSVLVEQDGRQTRSTLE
jgi:hypothetical protein